MRGLLRQRLLAVLTVIALLVATSTYVTHASDGLTTQHEDARCTLCLQFGSTAGTPSVGGVVQSVAIITRLGLAEPQRLPSFGREAGIRLPRAPPASHQS